ncbi:hypothetical protein EDB85DRAFT_1888417 [Lactarius pseudohatsudake]|nr:hypothetical protein EDB85DRAFT_1888417 [Lactarius pseudohatsudake]
MSSSSEKSRVVGPSRPCYPDQWTGDTYGAPYSVHNISQISVVDLRIARSTWGVANSEYLGRVGPGTTMMVTVGHTIKPSTVVMNCISALKKTYRVRLSAATLRGRQEREAVKTEMEKYCESNTVDGKTLPRGGHRVGVRKA